MAADNVLAEALLRIEHKIDILLKAGWDRVLKDPLTQLPMPLGDQRHGCPVCAQKVKYIVDPFNRVVSRQCACKTGLQAPIDLGSFAPPAAPARGDSNGSREDEEDRGDSDRGGGNRRR